MSYDYSDDIEDPGGASITELERLVGSLRDADLAVARLQAELEKAQRYARRIRTQDIPAKMEEMGVSECKLTSGQTIRIKEKVRASIPKAKARQAVAWLKAEGEAGMVKHDITTTFRMGQDAEAEELIRDLKAKGNRVKDKQYVHPSTLAAWAKRRLEDGEPLPMELFGVFRQKEAVVK